MLGGGGDVSSVERMRITPSEQRRGRQGGVVWCRSLVVTSSRARSIFRVRGVGLWVRKHHESINVGPDYLAFKLTGSGGPLMMRLIYGF